MKQPTRSVVVMCAAALAGGTGGAVVASEAVGGGTTQTVTRNTTAAGTRAVAATSGGALSASVIYARAKGSVAYVTATGAGSGAGAGTGSRAGGGAGTDGGTTSPYGEQGRSSGGTATGSGFVVSSDGYVVTNAHVIDGATSVTAKIGDGRALPAKVVGVDASTDIALLKVSSGTNLQPLTLADSSAVAVGDPTFAIGNPYGLDRTLTTGVVSALHRSIQSPDGYAINGVLQTDAALNPGNSGGPLLDAQGRVIGVNSQIATSSSSDGTSGGNTGVGFAVPSDTVARVVQQLRESGHATHAYLGVGTSDGTADDGTTNDVAGATVASVVASGPAAEAGLRAGDVVTKVGDVAVRDAEAMGTAVDAHRPNERVSVTYVRDGRTHTAEVTLGTRPAGTTQATAATTAP